MKQLKSNKHSLACVRVVREANTKNRVTRTEGKSCFDEGGDSRADEGTREEEDLALYNEDNNNRLCHIISYKFGYIVVEPRVGLRM